MTLRRKLILTHSLIAVLVIFLVTVIANAAINRYFSSLANTQAKVLATDISDALRECYEREGRWLTNIRRCFRVGDGQILLRQQINSRRVMLTDPNGAMLFDSADSAPARLNKQTNIGVRQAADVVVNGQVVGIVSVQPIEGQFGKAEDQFLRIVRRSIFLAGLTAAIAALIIGSLLAQNLTRSLRRLTTAAHQLAHGDRDLRLPTPHGQDEVAELTQAFSTLNAELRRSEESRRSMVADIAHELRTPLSVLQLELESLQDGVTTPTPAVINSLNDEVTLLKRLIDDLRTLSLADTGQLTLQMQSVDINDAVERVTTRLAQAMRLKNLQLQVNLAPNLPHVWADPDRLQQVIGNLLHNAIRYTPHDGTITIGTEQRQHDIMLRVRNTGAGFSPEEAADIFKRFYRTDKARARETGGSGLGLAIVRGLTESMGGKVWAESEQGAGVTFFVALPKEEQRAESKEQRS